MHNSTSLLSSFRREDGFFIRDDVEFRIIKKDEIPAGSDHHPLETTWNAFSQLLQSIGVNSTVSLDHKKIAFSGDKGVAATHLDPGEDRGLPVVMATLKIPPEAFMDLAIKNNYPIPRSKLTQKERLQYEEKIKAARQSPCNAGSSG